MSHIHSHLALAPERAVLGALLRSNHPAISGAVGDLRAEAFSPLHAEIFWRLVADALELDNDPDLAAALRPLGGASYLHELAEASGTADEAGQVAGACAVIRRRWDERLVAEPEL